MPITKQYLRYSSECVFNIIASANCNVTFVTWKGQDGRYAAAGASEDVIVWDFRLAEKVLVLPGDKFEATRLAASPNGTNLAVGYSDGSIKIFDLTTTECVCTFVGHRSAVVCLTFNSDGQLLASGAKDTELIVWDILAERGQLRLSGHKGAITQVCFMRNMPVVISSSKDTLVKFWDLDTGHCFKTLVGHKTEIWDLALMRDDKYLITGSSEPELYVWHLVPTHLLAEQTDFLKLTANNNETTEEDNFGSVECRKAGSILRLGQGRLQSLCTDGPGHVLACHSTDNKVELFYFNSEDEAQAKLKRRQKKAKKKTPDPNEEATEVSMCVSDEVKRLPAIKCSDKVKSCHLVSGNRGELRIITMLRNNKLELHSCDPEEKNSVCLRVLEKMGHRSEVRTLCFSSDALAVATGSGDGVKLWNRLSQSCLRTIETSTVYCLCFVPGDRHLLIGTDKKLLVADIGTAQVLEEIPAHDKEIWSIALTPDQRGCVTGSGDKTVKFWDFELVVPESESTKSPAKVLSLLHTRTLQLDEGVLCVCISPNSRHIAASLLDSTVKIFFYDTLKFFVSLYGHKLPVLCMDICYDSTIICTGSADRNIKLWGLDFGDCHKSLFAHDDTVTGVKFVPKTHYFFSCGKEGTVKQWDADSFDRIQTLDGHHGAAHNLSVSASHVASCGSDRVVRVWGRTAEPLVLEDEREEERAKEEETSLATQAESVVPGQPGHSLPSRKTVGAEKAAELLLEAVEVSETYRGELEEFKRKRLPEDTKPQPPPLMMAMRADDPDQFLVDTLRRIRASDLEEALLLVPFSVVCQLLSAIPQLVQKDCQGEVVLRTLSFLLRVHHEPIVGTRSLLPVVTQLQSLALDSVDLARNRVGCNLHGMQMLQRKVEAEQSIALFRDASQKRKDKNKKRRRQEHALKRAILTV